MKQVEWNRQVYEFFADQAMLSDEERYIMESRIKGVCVTQQAIHLNKSEITIHRMISTLKKKYDIIQGQYPDRLPKRRRSKQEKWMDEN